MNKERASSDKPRGRFLFGHVALVVSAGGQGQGDVGDLPNGGGL